MSWIVVAVEGRILVYEKGGCPVSLPKRRENILCPYLGEGRISCVLNLEKGGYPVFLPKGRKDVLCPYLGEGRIFCVLT